MFRFFQLNLVCFWVSVVLSLGLIFSAANAQTFEEYGVEVHTVAENIEIPWEVVFAPDDRIFFTERNGFLRVIEYGVLNPEPITELSVGGDGGFLASLIIGGGEGGLLGLALDPKFEENKFLYLYYSYSDGFSTFNRLVRYAENNNQLMNETILIDKIPGSFIHDGGRIKFGPDDKLYITTGDAGNPDSAQDLSSLAGKILRINPDGTIPEDNPFENSLVYSYGHRNPQGIDWDPQTGKLVATEHGPSGERGVAHDEINIIEPGKNYGWPEVVGDEHRDEFVDPLLHTGDETWAPSGATFYDSDNISEWTDKYFVATLRGSHLRILDLDVESNQVISSEVLFLDSFGRLRGASMGPDGNLYLLTSNRDGRGTPIENDDKILKVIPLSSQSKIMDDSLLSPVEETQPQPGGGCLVATAAFGTELAAQVQFLREIRDNTVMSTASGASFMTGFNQLYYSFSPTIADWERESPIFQEAVRAFITPMVSTLSIMTLADPGSEAEVLGLGISVIVLNLGVYVVAPVVFGFTLSKRLKSRK